ncbi:MAG TPA: Uma2 family endonuclease [Nitrospirae bacterium]|nr:Uma2 family endonuclease [Nitrospirota bacterium]
MSDISISYIFMITQWYPNFKLLNGKGTPNLIIEILSPGTIQKDRIVKMKTYAKYGIKPLWLTDPENQTLESFEFDRKKTCRLVSGIAGEEEFKPSLFPDFTIPLKKIWG